MIEALWEVDRLPLSNMKIENDITRVTGINFSFASFRYERRRRLGAVRAICTRGGNPDAAERILAAGAAVEAALGLLSSPIEMAGVDVSARDVRQFKAYLRTNVAREDLDGHTMRGQHAAADDDRAAVAAAVGALAPRMVTRALWMLDQLTGPHMALEGVGIDLAGDDTEFKFYFLPYRPAGTGEPYSDDETLSFIDTCLEAFGLTAHRARALAMVPEMRALGLRCSHLAVEIKPDGSHELKVNYNTIMTTNTSEWDHERYASPQAARGALRGVFRAADITLDDQALDRLTALIRPDGIRLDDFTTDFSKDQTSGKAYVRPMSDKGGGIYASARGART